jgi:malate synthase
MPNGHSGPVSTSRLRIAAAADGSIAADVARVLTPEALAFVEELVVRFRPRIDERLAARRAQHAKFAAGERPHFLPETAGLRAGDWRIGPVPAELQDRRVEITGPIDRKMVINALNSGASVFMADFEDATSPTWANLVAGHANLMDAVRGTISYVAPETGKSYALSARPAVLMARPRGLHLVDRHVLVDDRPAPGPLVDFGLFAVHNARELVRRGSGPYFYLPKLESHLDARVWNDVFLHAEDRLGLPVGTIKATVLIETLPASFEMDEILYELRDHSAGLNCGRWDYIFSSIKTLVGDRTFVLPDRGQVTMETPYLSAYVRRLIAVCHRRGAHAMGGMAAQIPIKDDPAANEAALAKVRADKLREVRAGHDGTWVAHPALVPVAKAIFDEGMPGPNQLTVGLASAPVTEAMLLEPPHGTRTEAGLRHNIRVGIQYIESWLRGLGCVPIYHLMEDAATAEICRTQVWQWVHHRATLDDGRAIDAALVDRLIAEELSRVRAEVGAARFDAGAFDQARDLFARLALAPALEEFLTVPAYDALVATEGES